jgi:potassium efflux system protein
LRNRLVSFLLLALAACLPTALGLAQDPPVAVVQDSPPTSSALARRLEEVRQDPDLTDELRTSLADVYTRALEATRNAETQALQADRFVEMLASAPADLQKLQAATAQLQERKAGPPETGLPLEELEFGLTAAQSSLEAATRHAAQLAQQPGIRSQRRAAIRTLRNTWQQRLAELPDRVTEDPAVPAQLLEARRILRAAERRLLEQSIRSVDAELTLYEGSDDLLRSQRDAAERGLEFAKADVLAWQQVLQEARAAYAQRTAQQTAAGASDVDPRLKDLASGNVELANELARVANDLGVAESLRATAAEQVRQIQSRFEDLQRRTKLLGTADSIGRLLHSSSAYLRNLESAVTTERREREKRLLSAQERSLDYDRDRAAIVRDDRGWLAAALPANVRLSDLPPNVLADAERLRDSRKQLLGQLRDSYTRLLDTYTNLEIDENRLEDIADDYQAFVTEKALDFRSSPPVWQMDVEDLADGLSLLVDVSAWQRAIIELWNILLTEVWPLLILAVLAVLAALLPSFRRRLARHGEAAVRGTNTSYAPTALALIDTMLISLPIPTILWFVGSRLRAHEGVSADGRMLASAAHATAMLLLLLLAIRAMARPRGLGEAHFRWQATTMQHLRRNIPRLLPAAFPLSFALGALESHSGTLSIGALGSLVLMLILGMATVIGFATLHPRSGLVGGTMVAQPTALYRSRWVWFLLGTGTPAALLTMATLGYDYSALQLSQRLLHTTAIVFAGVCLHALVLRRLLLERRRLHIKKAQERLAAAKSAAEGGTSPDQIEAPDIDPQSIAQQTQTIVRGAISIAVLLITFQIWVDVLPALGIFHDVKLWTIDNSGADVERITLADLLLALLLLFGGLAAARNLPGVLELLVLQRLRMQSGERNAVTTLARYGIVILSVLLSFHAIGIGWDKVQWLIAAVSVGLGFGLQEIFANFVSGLILLFERPIRVGDLVSVGEVTGRVRQIKIRATTILDWDLKELVVPNREFVTGHFVNWTLCDAIVRWKLAVGVAYGSDTRMAMELLLRAADEEADVEREPKPEALFVNFGASSLDLELRVFVNMNEHDFSWRTRIHQRIDALFREHGIEIAFPQQDVHLDVRGPLLESLRTSPGGPSRPLEA